MSTVNGFQVGSETLKYNYESLDNYNTPNFSTSSSTTYAVGDYVMYNGKLYKCTTATTGGTWVSGSWAEAVLSDDVSDLTRQLSDVHQVVTVTLTAAGWSSNQQVATVTGVLADVTKQMISPIPAPASEAAYVAAGVMAISQAADSLVFSCVHTPTDDLTVYVFVDEIYEGVSV